MHTLALPKSVLCIELGPQWPMAHLNWPIGKKKDGQANAQLLGKIWTVVSCFGQFSRPKVTLNKTAAIVRNCGGQAWAKCFGEIGEDVKNFVNYLGVRLGNIRHHQDDQGWGLTIEQAFAPTP